MKVLIACEFSGIIRDEFIKLGHDAWSCDLIPSEKSGPHIQGDVLKILNNGWDLMIAHPPCQYLAICGARWHVNHIKEKTAAIDFFMALMNAPIPKICVENPVSIMSTKYRQPDQIIQPWQFGHGEMKRTCLWLKNLPPLIPTNIVNGRERRIWSMGPKPDRAKNRSRSFIGIGAAMANQWGIQK